MIDNAPEPELDPFWVKEEIEKLKSWNRGTILGMALLGFLIGWLIRYHL